MDEQKQTTSKRHLILIGLAVFGILAIVSVSVPYESDAPAMRPDEVHRQAGTTLECLTCHENSENAAAPMNHPVKDNCGFCHARPN